MTSNLSSELAVSKIGNRFDLVLVATHRVKQLRAGHLPRVTPQKTTISTALLEIEEGKYTKEEFERSVSFKTRRGYKPNHKQGYQR